MAQTIEEFPPEHGAWNDPDTLLLMLQEIEQTTCHSTSSHPCQLRREGVAKLQLALQVPDPNQARRMVHQVLQQDPNCLIAYSVLAYLEPQLEDALRTHEVGLRYGKQELQAKQIMNAEGRIVSFTEALPYLRLLQSYALGLLQAGKWEEALQASRQLLRADPSDPFGIREMKVPLLLLLGYWDQAAWHLQRYASNDSLTLQVAKGYLMFAQHHFVEAKLTMQNLRTRNDLLLAWLAGEDGISAHSPTTMEAVYAYSQLFLLAEANPSFRDFCARIRMIED